MRKITPLILFTFMSYWAYSNATVAQKEWRWRKDNGTEATAEWASNQNTAGSRSICNTSENIRLRMAFQINPDPMNPGSEAQLIIDSRISYSTSPDGPFTAIPFNATDQHFELATSANVSNGQATVQRLTLGGTYAAGQIIDENAGANITFSTPGEVTSMTEHEWVIRPTSNVEATTYYFRLADMESYSDPLPQMTFTASAVTGSAVINNVSCNGEFNGSINLTPSGGTAPYTYDWGEEIATEDRVGLKAGIYTVSITDANGCTGNVDFTVNQPSVISSTVSAIDVSCNGGSNGSATVTTIGGTGQLSYSWSPSGGTGATASGLTVGDYTVTITDANSCTATTTVTITEPTAINATVSSTNVSCNGGSNGSATVTASGGTGQLFYSWSPSGGTGATASGLAAGNYTVTVTDNNSCSATRTVAVTQPVAITASIVQDLIACAGTDNGTATVTATGGTGSLHYAWSPSGGTSSSAAGLAPGQYTVTISDDNNCEISKTIDIVEEICTGINNPMSSEMSNNILMYPNPSAGDGIISIGNSAGLKILKVSLMDVNGRKITASENVDKLMIENLEAGMYMVEIVSDKGVAVKKLLVK